jgi:hypothetical protein
MHIRVQAWFPFTVDICLNGRQWLAHQMDQAGIAYRQCDNCFVWVEDFVQAQKLLDHQLQSDWPALLQKLLLLAHPLQEEITGAMRGLSYYWSASQTEFATDIVFDNAQSLQRLCDSDYALLQAVSQGQFILSGLRNSDLRATLYKPAKDLCQRRRQAAAVTRKLAMLRAHGLLRKIPHSHHYQLTPKGRRIITALLAACHADVEQLTKLAA